MVNALAYYDTTTIMAVKSFIVQAPEVVIAKFLTIILHTNTRLGQSWMEVVNTLAYYDTATIYGSKSLIVQAPEVLINFLQLSCPQIFG